VLTNTRCAGTPVAAAAASVTMSWSCVEIHSSTRSLAIRHIIRPRIERRGLCPHNERIGSALRLPPSRCDDHGTAWDAYNLDDPRHAPSGSRIECGLRRTPHGRERDGTV
jgi:hypothetical protein